MTTTTASWHKRILLFSCLITIVFLFFLYSAPSPKIIGALISKSGSKTTGNQSGSSIFNQDQIARVRNLNFIGLSNTSNSTIVTPSSPKSNSTDVKQKYSKFELSNEERDTISNKTTVSNRTNDIHNFIVTQLDRITEKDEGKNRSAVVEKHARRNMLKITNDALLEIKKPVFNSMLSGIEPNRKCDPAIKIVFIKTHKTASTTVASMFQRYGYRNNLTFALPKRSHMFNGFKYFNHTNVLPIPKNVTKTPPQYDILTNHAVYYRPEMDKVIPNATYITILRNPVTQLESAFGYFEMAKNMGLSNNSRPFWSFMQNPPFYSNNYTKKDAARKMQIRNGQLHNLGFNPQLYNDTSAIRAKIDALANELDLVLITEYLDESLILLKRCLCWSFDDILYISAGIRSASHRYNISEDLERQRWNYGDVELYNHFNQTLWRKVSDYGPEFQNDLEKFRRLERETFNKCVDVGNTNKKDKREDKFVINPANSGKYCQDLLRADVPYTKLLHNLYNPKPQISTKPKLKRTKPKPKKYPVKRPKLKTDVKHEILNNHKPKISTKPKPKRTKPMLSNKDPVKKPR